ncbi:MAG: hypothetical protein ACYTEQ_04680 [Planctomycetota bacterium]|jgi:hypothetical protein
MLRFCPALAVLLALVPPGFVSADESPFNVDFFCGWGGCYRPMEWTPVEIGIAATLAKPFAGTLILSASQDGLNTLNVTHEFVLTPDFPVHVPLVTKLAFATSQCNVRIVDKQRGRTCWASDFELWDLSTRDGLLTIVHENDLFIGMVGHRKFGLLRLSDQAVCTSTRGEGEVYLKDKLPRMVPFDWTGFASLDLLMLYDPDWTVFNRHQLSAVTQWVSNGGRLLIVLGSHPLPAENPLGDIFPFEVEPAKQIAIPTDTLQQWQLNSSEPETTTCWPLKPKPQAHLCHVDNPDDDECLFATAYVGFGKVGILAFDPSRLSDKQTANSARFWVGRIAAVLEDGRPGTRATEAQEGPEPAYQAPSFVPFALCGDLTHPDSKEGGIEMTIGGLRQGKYRMTSYHNNPSSRHSPIDIYEDGVLRNRDIRQTQRMVDRRAGKAVTALTVSETNDVVIKFVPVSSSGLNKRAMLCGFELTGLGAGRGPGSEDGGTQDIKVDFGATGQIVADGFIGLGFGVNDRKNYVKFDDADGLPAGVTITLRPTTADDDLQFNPSRSFPTNPRRSRRRISSAVPLNRSIRFVESTASSTEDRANLYEYAISQAHAASNQIMEHLYAISEMRPLSIWWVILLLTALAVLLGPVDYKLLKRFDRLPLTWLTCAVWITLFTVGAYYGVQALRGGKMQLRVVSVLDGIQGDNGGWSAAYMGLFAPHSDDYQLEGLNNDQWWSGIAPMRESVWAMRREAGTRNIYCYQHDGGNLPYSLPINIWTMQCLLNESPLPQLPFTAEVRLEGDELILDISNQSDSRIKTAYVLFSGGRIFDFGPVPARAERQFRGRLRRRQAWADLNMNYHPVKFQCEKAFFAQGCSRRTQTMAAYLAHGAAVICAEYENAPLSLAVKDHSYDYDHVQLVRLLVFPEDSVPESPQPR